jgi:hypothetical protein
MAAAATLAVARIESLRADWHRMHDDDLLAEGALRAAGATLAFALLSWSLFTGVGRSRERLQTAWRSVRDQAPAFSLRDWPRAPWPAPWSGSVWCCSAVLGFLWLRQVLDAFVLTEPLSRELGTWVWHQAEWIGRGVLDAIPGLSAWRSCWR